MIVMKAIGGLCNRLRTIDNLKNLSSIIGTDLKVIWESNNELNSPYTKLFRFNNDFILKETGYYSKNNPFRLLNGLITKFKLTNAVSLFKYENVFFGDDIQKKLAEGFDFKTLNPLKNHFFFYWGKIIPVEQPYKNLQPVDSILEIINTVTKDFNSKTIGVHIRRTDNENAIKNSPVQLFVEKMSELYNKDHETNFYLATDDPETENYIKSLYPGRVKTYQKELARSSETGIRDAVVDLWALSKTSTVLGSHWSSFSHTACDIGKIKEITIKTQ